MSSGSAFGLPPRNAPDRCVCGSRRPLTDCCAALHHGSRQAATPEELMRSRYAAFVHHNSEYLLHTWHPSTRPPTIRFDPHHHWTGLLVLDTPPTRGNQGIVEYRAFAERSGVPSTLHEISSFVREDHRWYYVDGVFP